MPIIGSFPTVLANGQPEDATQVMSLFSWIQSQVNGNACSATTTNNVLKGDGLGNTTAAISGVDFVYPNGDFAITTGSANAYVASLGETINALIEGLKIRVKANFQNTGPASINVNALGSKPIVDYFGNPLIGNEIINLGNIELTYNTSFNSGSGAWVLNLLESEFSLIDVKDFGATGNGVTDDTTAIQNAINYAIGKSNACIYIGTGSYLVSHIVVQNANGLTIFGTGALIGKPTGSYESVLTIKNSTAVSVIGNLSVSGTYNTGYACGIAVYTDNGTQASNLMFDNVNIANVQLGWKFGVITAPDALVSEIVVKGGYMYGVPSAVLAIGAETVVSFVGCILQTGVGGNPTGWSALQRQAVTSIGAYIEITGGELGIVDVQTGGLVVVQPITSALLGNMYGSVSLINVQIESASQYCVINNPSNLTPIAATSAEAQTRFISCSGYHSANAFQMVQISADYTGSILFNNNNFYCGSVRTLGNIAASGNLCNIYCDEQSFGYNFVQGLVAISGGIAHFTRRMIFEVGNCNSQSLPSGIATTLIWTAATNTGDTQRFIGNYSTSTGIFTVPAGGLKSVAVNFVIRTTQPTYPLNAAILINGSPIDFIPTMIGGANNGGWLRSSVELGDLTAGTTIAVQAQQIGIASATNGGQYENMIIVARN